MKNRFKSLSDKELDWLDNFLLGRIEKNADTRDKDAGVLDVSELDGLFTAIVSGPQIIQPAQWLPQIWGDFEPVWKQEEEFETVLSLMVRHMYGIAATLMEQPQAFEPMFLERMVDNKSCTIVEEWCEGFMSGVLLAAEQWHMDEIDMEILLVPMKAFVGEQAKRTHACFSQPEIKNIQNAICQNVRDVYAYWLGYRQSEMPFFAPIKPVEPCPGHNDPCLCGSGRKYSKCCLH